VNVRWLIEALRDIQSIRDYIAQDHPHTAREFVVELFDSVTSQLQEFPRLGRIVPEKGDPAFREVIHGNYRIMYRIADDIVEVQTVLHSKRLYTESQDRH
jgi:toxin ParE1/3/4